LRVTAARALFLAVFTWAGVTIAKLFGYWIGLATGRVVTASTPLESFSSAMTAIFLLALAVAIIAQILTIAALVDDYLSQE
jgi:hypothetical protein